MKPQKPSPIRLTRFNRAFLQLLFFPIFTFLYMPINRHIVFPKLGSGAPYTDMHGAIIENYFSANSVVRILFYVILAAELFFSVKYAKDELHGWKRWGYLLLCAVFSLIGGFFFLQFSLWSA